MDLFPFFVALFHIFGQAVIKNFNCLSIDKEEIFVLFPTRQVTFAQTDQAVKFLKRFIPMMKSGSHICISKIVKVFSSSQLSG